MKLPSIHSKLSPRADFAIGAAGLVALIAIWCILTYGGFVAPLFIPSPTDVWEGWVHFANMGKLVPSIVNSTERVVKALLLVVGIGIPLGLIMGSSPFFDALLRKPINAAKALPPTGVVGVIVLWLGLSEKTKVVFLFVGAVFYMIVLVKGAVQNVREDFIKVAVDVGATPRQVLWKVLLPAALPSIWDAIAVCNGIMWTYIVLAEYIEQTESNAGLGYMIYQGSRLTWSGPVFAALILIAAICTFSDWMLQWVRRSFFNW
jgi:NitT/TauT family transport system permease protein